MRQVTPLAARSCQIENGIDDFAPRVFAWSALHAGRSLRKEERDAFPLFIGKIGRVRFASIHTFLMPCPLGHLPSFSTHSKRKDMLSKRNFNPFAPCGRPT